MIDRPLKMTHPSRAAGANRFGLYSAVGFALITISCGLLTTWTGKYFWIVDPIHYVLIPAIIYRNALRKGVIDRGYILEFPKRATAESVVTCLSAYALAWMIATVVARVLIRFFPSLYFNGFSYNTFIPQTMVLHFIVAVYFAVTAGFAEEFIYRGLIFKTFDSVGKVNRSAYVLISATIFGAAHLSRGSSTVFGAFSVGLVAAWLMLRYRVLGPLIVAHAIFDFAIFI